MLQVTRCRKRVGLATIHAGNSLRFGSHTHFTYASTDGPVRLKKQQDSGSKLAKASSPCIGDFAWSFWVEKTFSHASRNSIRRVSQSASEQQESRQLPALRTSSRLHELLFGPMMSPTQASSPFGRRLATTGAYGRATARRTSQSLPDPDICLRAPLLLGTTKFEPRHDVKNIMITGGAGFM